MIRKLRLLYFIIKASSMSLAEYRFDFFLTALVRLLESLVSFTLIFFMFSHITDIAGWTRDQVLIMNLTYTVIMGLFLFVFRLGAKDFSQNLNRGDIDKYLTKPIDLQLFVSLGGLDWSQLFRVSGTFILVFIFMSRLEISLWFLPVYVISLISALLTLYAMAFIITSLVFHFGRINNVVYLSQIVWDIGKMPTGIFSHAVQVIFATAVPVIMAGTLPTGLLTGRFPLFYLLYEILLVSVFLILSRIFLNLGLRKYSSAGG